MTMTTIETGKSETGVCGAKLNPPARIGSSLNWLVVNPDGKLLAILDSESEAYYFTHNRGHAHGAVYFKAPCDYAAAHELLAALKQTLDALWNETYGNCDSEWIAQTKAMASAAIAIAEKQSEASE